MHGAEPGAMRGAEHGAMRGAQFQRSCRCGWGLSLGKCRVRDEAARTAAGCVTAATGGWK
eukprot:364824-Chlamydomonas_euryale.AAC.3